jgi:hypothetical protein
MTYNPQKHHRRSIRLKGYDYSQAGLYFITMVTKNRACLFGKIENGAMILNDAGNIAHDCWLEIPNHFPNVILHEHIIMPNHIHGIIELKAQPVGAANFTPNTTNPPHTPNPPQKTNHNHGERANGINGANGI